MNKFEKVSFNEYSKTVMALDDLLASDWNAEQILECEYQNIRLPRRAHDGDAGYDFFVPYDMTILPGDELKIATGIRCFLEKDKFLMLVPRSGLGSKFRLRLNNTVGIIDSGYSNSDNEGHIMATLANEGNSPIAIPQGNAFMQGIIVRYSLTDDDVATGMRNGGFGSSDNMMSGVAIQ